MRPDSRASVACARAAAAGARQGKDAPQRPRPLQVGAIVLEELLAAAKAPDSSFEVGPAARVAARGARLTGRVGPPSRRQLPRSRLQAPWARRGAAARAPPRGAPAAQVAAVVSQPGKPKGRGNKATPVPSPVEQLARQAGVPDDRILCPR
jgi:hypothetical protein